MSSRSTVAWAASARRRTSASAERSAARKSAAPLLRGRGGVLRTGCCQRQAAFQRAMRSMTGGRATISLGLYDPTSDSFLCPAGQRLHPYSSSIMRGLKKINYRNSQACRDCAICPQCTGNQFRSVSRLESEAVLAFRVVPRSEIGGSTITICRARRSSSRGRQKGFRTKSARSSSKKMASTLDDERTRQRGDDLFIVGILTWTGNTVVTRSRQMCLTAARIRGLSSTRT